MARIPFTELVELLERLLREGRGDPRRSRGALDRIDELLAPDEVPIFAGLVLDTVDAEGYFAVGALHRLADPA